MEAWFHFTSQIDRLPLKPTGWLTPTHALKRKGKLGFSLDQTAKGCIHRGVTRLAVRLQLEAAHGAAVGFSEPLPDAGGAEEVPAEETGGLVGLR